MAVSTIPVNGNAVLVKIGSTVVGSQTGVTFTENMETIDSTVKSDADTGTTYIKGRYSATASMSSLYINGDTALVALRAALRDGTTVTLVRMEPEDGAPDTAADYLDCTAFVTSIADEFSQDSMGTCSVDFAISGKWAAV